MVRHELDDRIARLDEVEFASQQQEQINEILGYLDLLATNKSSKTLENGQEIKIPKGEAPAYFEWAIWRTFLAIDSLVNNPWEARQFKVDQDFLPVGPAPGGRPDMVFEFDQAVIVVEVTLTALPGKKRPKENLCVVM